MDPVPLLTGLLKLYSPSRQEAEAVAYLVEQMRRLGFEAFRDEAGNAVGRLGNGPKEIALLGHIDTAPGFIPVREENGRLYGRGAVDAKGPLAAFVAAAAQVGARPGYRVVVIGAVEEECATSAGARFVAGEYSPIAAVIGEPSGWDRVTLGYRGSVQARYRVRQAMSHSAGRGQTAPEAAVAYWQRILAHAEKVNAERGATRAFDQLSAALTHICSESNGHYDAAEASLDVRIPVGLTLEGVTADLRSLAAGAEIDFEGGEPPFRAGKNTPLVRAFLSAIRAEGGSPAFTLKTGTADMNIVGPAWGCPILAYGPGDSNLDHTPDEHVEIEELRRGVRVLARALERIAELDDSE